MLDTNLLGLLLSSNQVPIVRAIPSVETHPLLVRVCKKLTERLYLEQTSFQPPMGKGDISSPL